MALRKAKTTEQFHEAQRAVLEPGEQVIAESLTTAGPSPWLAVGVGILVLYLLGMRIYFMVVTDRRVLFMVGTVWTGRPKGLAFADPRSGVLISDVTPARMWSHLLYQRPEGKAVRLNFHRMWREEFQGIVQALEGPGATVEQASMPPPPAP